MRPIQAVPSPPRACAARDAPLRSARLVAENTLSAVDLIWPVFVREGEGVEEPVPSMPGVVRRSVDKDGRGRAGGRGSGHSGDLPFSLHRSDENRSKDCAEAWNPDNLSNRATRAIKKAGPGSR